MKDRFRVRAWNEVGKYYLYDVQNSIYSHNRQRYTFVDAVNKELLKKWKLEQCSGVRDKNGQLIYENDIVQWGCTNVLIRFSYDRVISFAGLCGVDEDIEVIGNIHKNPELLGGNKDER